MSTVFRRVTRPFIGKGLGNLPLAMKTYNLLWRFSKPNGIILVKVQGDKMYIDMSDPSIPKELYLTGIHEREVTPLFKRVVKEGMTVIDIGAHIGYYTLLAANLVGEKGRVFAFEPGSGNYSLLVRNIEVNEYENVIPLNKAVSNKSGTAKLFLCSDNKGDHRLWPSCEDREWVEVEIISLDKFFESYDTKIDVIKMDIQGGEMAALQGMDKLIMRNLNLKIITEFWPSGIEETGFLATEFLNKLIKYDFKLYHISHEIEPTDFAHLMKICEDKKRRGSEDSTNIYCERG